MESKLFCQILNNMTTELLYQICTIGVLPAWLLLIVAPNWKFTQLIVHSFFIPLLLGLLYIGLQATDDSGNSQASPLTLEGARHLFASPQGFLAGWVHYIVFDLFVGAWAVRDASRQKINHFIVIPCLLLMIMLGPVGLLLYSIVRIIKTKSITIND
jgi:hypothetical protein